MPCNTTRRLSDTSASRPALRRRDHFDCRQCGQTTQRAGVAQVFCSPRCKQRFSRANRATAKILEFSTHTTGAVPSEQKLPNENKELQGSKMPSSVAFHIVGGGYRWPGAKLDRATVAKVIRAELGNYELRQAPADGAVALD